MEEKELLGDPETEPQDMSTQGITSIVGAVPGSRGQYHEPSTGALG